MAMLAPWRRLLSGPRLIRPRWGADGFRLAAQDALRRGAQPHTVSAALQRYAWGAYQLSGKTDYHADWYHLGVALQMLAYGISLGSTTTRTQAK